MILGLLGNFGKAKFRKVLPPLVAELRKRGAAFVLDEIAAADLDLSPEEKRPAAAVPDVATLVLSFGGDGTLLRTVHTVGHRRIPIMGVNLGPGLGYLTEMGVNELAGALDSILEQKYRVEERMMLSLDDEANSVSLGTALNDVIVGHASVSRTVPIEVMIDGRPVATYRCDGMLVATPTGSTAYTLSAGGPIVEPSLNVMIVTPICPHTLTMRPVVISAQRTVEIRPGEKATLAADGETLKTLRPGDMIRVKRAPFTTLIANITGHDFYHVLRAKLHWGAARLELPS
jgi:NAD+ kinase